jgi:hypothetical protein
VFKRGATPLLKNPPLLSGEGDIGGEVMRSKIEAPRATLFQTDELFVGPFGYKIDHQAEHRPDKTIVYNMRKYYAQKNNHARPA